MNRTLMDFLEDKPMFELAAEVEDFKIGDVVRMRSEPSSTTLSRERLLSHLAGKYGTVKRILAPNQNSWAEFAANQKIDAGSPLVLLDVAFHIDTYPFDPKAAWRDEFYACTESVVVMPDEIVLDAVLTAVSRERVAGRI